MKKRLQNLKKNIALILYFVKTSYSISKSYIWGMIFSSIIGIIAGYNFIIMPKFFIGELMNLKRINVIALYLVIFVSIIFITKNISDIISNMMEIEKTKLLKGLQNIIDRSIMEMDYEHIEDPKILDLREQVMESIHGDFFYRMFDCLTSIVTESINLISLGILISFLNPIIIVILVLIVLMNNIFNKKINETTFFWDKIFGVFNRRLGYFHSITNDFSIGKDSRIYDIKGLLNDEFDDFNKKSYEANMRGMKKSGLFYGLISINEQIQLLIVYIYITYKVFTGVIGIGGFSMYVSAASQFGKSIFRIMDSFVGFRLISNYIDMYMQLLKLGENKKRGGLKIVDTDDICIEFRNVSFKYPRAEQYTLKNINITVYPHEKLSVIGENGAGKTTFIKLLCGLYRPTSGEILVNGINITELDYESYIQKISAVFQDFKLFACSIKENIAFDDFNNDEEKIIGTLNKSGILEKINTLSNGIDTQLYKYFDENGIELSGGENQKLVISRAIYKNSPVIVLDEPTASLDPYAEYEIFSKLNDISQGKTVIFISHRLSSCRICDKIAVFHKGEIVQYGTHDELIGFPDGKYYEMYTAQAQYYI
ncbi:MAG: ABC transporter ATP-binding protein/permease [Oscillospiraceae bacterium]|nr:ABC transporter ATP-binding protein/permease [Oscillospiraceae bacterium]